MNCRHIKFSDVAIFIRGVTFEKSVQEAVFNNFNVPLLRSGNISEELNIKNDLIYVPSSIVSKEQMLRKGDIVICLSSGSPQVVGKSAPLEQDWKGTVGGFCGIIRPRDSINAQYLALWMRSPAFIGWRDKQARGANIQNLRFSELGFLEIALPHENEQRRIAAQLKAQLAAVEEARQAAQAQAREAEALEAAIYRETFQAIVPVAVPPEFEDAPAGWRWAKLTELARLESGHTPSRIRPDWWGGDISWVSLTEIRALDGRWISATQIKTNAEGIKNSSARVLPRGTVCFSRTASVGFVTIMAEPMATSQDFANWVCGDGLDPEFLMYALIRARSELRALATGATHKTIYMPMLEAFQICAPDRATQERIVQRLKTQLEAVQEIRHGTLERLAEIEKLPARLLAQAFGEA